MDPDSPSASVQEGTSGTDEGPEDDGLSELERGVLEFERRWWKQAGAKETAIRERFDMSATRYYQVLNRLLDSPEALAAEPSVVIRLRRIRAGR